MRTIRLSIAIVTLLFVNISSGVAQKSFNEKEAFLFHLRNFNMNPQSYVDEYLYRFDNATYTQTRNDDFEYHAVKSKANTKINAEFAALDYTTVYSLPNLIPTKLGDYNFDIDAFAFTPIQEGFYIRPIKSSAGTPASLNQIFFFTNGNAFSKLPVPRDQARLLNGQMKNEEGIVDKTVYIKVNFFMTKKTSHVMYGSDKTPALFGEIYTIEIYQDKYKSKKIGVLSAPSSPAATAALNSKSNTSTSNAYVRKENIITDQSSERKTTSADPDVQRIVNNSSTNSGSTEQNPYNKKANPSPQSTTTQKQSSQTVPAQATPSNTSNTSPTAKKNELILQIFNGDMPDDLKLILINDIKKYYD